VLARSCTLEPAFPDGLASRKRPPTVARSPKVIQTMQIRAKSAWFRITFGDLVVIAMATGGGIAGISHAAGLNTSNGPSAPATPHNRLLKRHTKRSWRSLLSKLPFFATKVRDALRIWCGRRVDSRHDRHPPSSLLRLLHPNWRHCSYLDRLRCSCGGEHRKSNALRCRWGKPCFDDDTSSIAQGRTRSLTPRRLRCPRKAWTRPPRWQCAPSHRGHW
jgi:hypothetical protein